MRENLLNEKSYSFAVRIIKLTEHLQTDKNEFMMSKEVLRCGTAIGALICEADSEPNEADYLKTLRSALKEAKKTAYWLSLIKDSENLREPAYTSLKKDCEELITLLTSVLEI